MKRSRIVLLVIGGVVATVIILGGLIGWRAWQVNGVLQDAVADTESLRTALESGDQSQIDTSLSALQSSSTEARELTGGWIWSVATVLPVLGDDASGVRTAADVVSDLSDDGLAPLARSATQLDTILPEDGRVDVEAVASLQAPVATAAAALMTAEERLAAQDSSVYVERFRGKYRELQSQVRSAAQAMDSASVAVDLLPELLGADGTRNYLVVFQNNAEVRATGGLPGALSVLTVDDGDISLGRQASAGSFGERATPVLPLSDDEIDIFSEKLGTYLLDANFTPDWPRAAELIRARWEERFPEELDGVLTLDTVAVSYLLAATGPVEVGPYTITADNAVDVLLHQVYRDIADPAAQDVFFRQVAATVFDRIAEGEVGRPRDLLRALVRSGDEGRLSVHLSDEAEQARIAERRVAGAVTDAQGASDAVDITFLDGTGSKMSYFLRYDVRGMATSCADGQERLEIKARVESLAPPDAASLPPYITGGGVFGIEPGKQLVNVSLFSPSGGEVTSLTIRGEEYKPSKDYLDDRMVSTGNLLLERGKPADVTWTVTAPASAAPVPLRVTPGVEAEDASSTISGACP